MTEPVVAQKAPFRTEVAAGRASWWCACGRSARRPFCDGSHQGTSLTPVEHEAGQDGALFFCGCEHAGGPPLCDGSHAAL